ncbi:hypothetical protein CAEBREN_02664 [Caenorhabditis brenneri]|uniref:Uncharacterized protein n=1 Tax=Caenorhabditis brenneri TaxID=135651 RepID=G0MFS1_CAEBE|nr:hypothetical protein CAEBREN_02664 [Caenorhabditis brenneri]
MRLELSKSFQLMKCVKLQAEQPCS